MELLIFSIVVFIGIYWSLFRPTHFVNFYLIAHSKFLGFYDLEVYLISHFSIGMFLLNIITLFAGSFRFKKICIENKMIKLLLIVIIFLMIYGIILPVYLGDSTLVQSIIASKQFWNFSILFYLISAKEEISIEKIINTIKFLGIYFSIVILIYIILNYGPPNYLEYRSNGYKYLRVYYPTFISFALFFYVLDFFSKKRFMKFSVFIIMIVGCFCLIYCGHSAIAICTIVSIFFLLLIGLSKKKLIPTCFLLLFCLSVCFSIKSIYDPVLNFFLDLNRGHNHALISRQKYNAFRWHSIELRPYSGYGFIHKSSKINNDFKSVPSNKYMETLSVIDSGYVDLFGKFGYILTFFYLAILFFIIIKPFIFYKKKQLYEIFIALFLFQFYVVNYTWSVFSFGHGILPISLGLFFLNFNKTFKEN